MPEPYVIRPAQPAEAAILSDLALRSKAYWDYHPNLLEAVRPELTLTPDYIRTNPVYILEIDQSIKGFYALRHLPDEAVDLEFLFIDPEVIGGGYGRKMWQHAVQTAKQHGCRYMFIDSDPYAETFYQAMGAQRIAHSESPAHPGSMIPLMRYALNGQ